MSASATATPPVPAATDSPMTPGDLAGLFYGSEPAPAAATPGTEAPPAPTPTPEASSMPTEASATTEEKADSKEAPAGEEPAASAEKKPSQEESQRAAAARLGNQVKELTGKLRDLEEQNRVLTAKVNGTYEEPAAPTPEEVAARAEFKGREQASRSIAEEKYGAEALKEQVYAPGSEYEQLVKENPYIHARVMRHPQPAVAAMQALERHRFEQTYGEDSAQWKAKIEAELRPKLLAEFKQQTHAPVGKPVPTVTDARSTSAKGTPMERSISDLFYGAAKA